MANKHSKSEHKRLAVQKPAAASGTEKLKTEVANKAVPVAEKSRAQKLVEVLKPAYETATKKGQPAYDIFHREFAWLITEFKQLTGNDLGNWNIDEKKGA